MNVVGKPLTKQEIESLFNQVGFSAIAGYTPSRLYFLNYFF